ncbi:transposase family protein [Micromonospora endolithica]|uniref:Transposase family protein n=1 Tax=Micromonospora endolithica TaxID=230091 RepID=A0A3A9ZUK0_9ACTN|nr:transposase family protein [Micromonospora endolithica]TWJ22430.1 DDE superfamily endonuclease [Micromonospora endolithica]
MALSSRTLNHLADLVCAERIRRQGRWRLLDAGQQALLALAHLHNGITIARLACGFAVSVTTAWRYVREAIDLLAAHAEDLNQAMRRIARLAYAILDAP